MATIKENRVNGKIFSYKFTCCLGRDSQGKQIRRYTTWQVPEGMTSSKAKKLAEREAKAWEAAMREEYDFEDNTESQTPVVEELLDQIEMSRFIREVWFPLSIENGDYKPKTISFYHDTAKNIADFFEGYSLQGVGFIAIQKFLIHLRKERGYSSQYVHHHHRTLSMIFGFAEKQGIIKENPMENVPKPKLEKKKVVALSPEETKLFFTALNDCPLDFRCLLHLMITTGLRRGECLGLQWKDIDLKNSCLKVQRNVTQTTKSGIVVSTPKTTASLRTVPLMDSTLLLLKLYKRQEQRKHFEITLDECFVFHSKDNCFKPRDPNSVTRRLKRFMKRNNLPDMSPHDLRHSCATLMLGCGADIKSVQQILGHSRATTTLDFYIKSDLEQMQTATDKFASAFGL